MSFSDRQRSVRRLMVTAVVAVGLLVGPATVAGADPAPGDPSTRLSELSRQSEETTEAMHNAQIDLDAKTADRDRANAVLAENQAALDAAQAQIAAVQPTIDKIAQANYQGARTNRLFALMVSDSPQQMLDQMSALDVISAETRDKVDTFMAATAAAQTAKDASQQSADAARVAAEQARAVSDDLQNKQSQLQTQIADVMAAFGALSGEDKAALAGTPYPPGFDPATILATLTPGSRMGALQAAFTQIGKPYVWGATGPDGYDCSGLMVWSYKQVGVTLPRSSQAQAAGGTPVDRQDLQPGDLVIFYPGATHVGMYVGNGNVIHASTFGVPVKVESMARWPFYGARRY